MATPPKTIAGSSPSDTSGAPQKAAAPKAGVDPQKVDFDMDPDVKKQLDAGGSYKPGEEKAKEYFPPGPHPITSEGIGGAAGGVNLSTEDVKTEPTADKSAESKSEAKK